jgi:hypothetical protein
VSPTATDKGEGAACKSRLFLRFKAPPPAFSIPLQPPACAAGTFYDLDTATCATCPTGATSNAGSDRCSELPMIRSYPRRRQMVAPPRWQASPAASHATARLRPHGCSHAHASAQPTACADGYYLASPKAASCTQCGTGSSAKAGATACTCDPVTKAGYVWNATTNACDVGWEAGWGVWPQLCEVGWETKVSLSTIVLPPSAHTHTVPPHQSHLRSDWRDLHLLQPLCHGGCWRLSVQHWVRRRRLFVLWLQHHACECWGQPHPRRPVRRREGQVVRPFPGGNRQAAFSTESIMICWCTQHDSPTHHLGHSPGSPSS